MTIFEVDGKQWLPLAGIYFMLKASDQTLCDTDYPLRFWLGVIWQGCTTILVAIAVLMMLLLLVS